ncbi:hypothetical protein [Oceanobacillus sp. CAU 1775]
MEKQFNQMMNATEGTSGSEIERVLGFFILIGAIEEKFALADLMEAEANKVDAVADAYRNGCATQAPTVGELQAVNDSVASVFENLCCVMEAINNQIDRGLGLLNEN